MQADAPDKDPGPTNLPCCLLFPTYCNDQTTLQASPVRNRPGGQQSPRASPRSSTFKVPPLAATSPRTSAAAAAAGSSPRTPTSSRAIPRTPPGPTHSVSPRLRPDPRAVVGSRSRGGNSSNTSTAHTEAPQAVAQDNTDNSNHSANTTCSSRRASSATAGRETTSKTSSIDSSITSSRQMLTRQVQLLVSEYAAKHRLQQLQAKQAAVQGRRDQLLASKAQLQLRQLRR